MTTTLDPSLQHMARTSFTDPYISALLEAIALRRREDDDSWVLQCDGAFPTLVAQLSGIEPRPDVELFEWDRVVSPFRLAEEDLALSEWYFTPKVARALAAQCSEWAGDITLIGCPTVANALAAYRDDITLIDPSPWIIPRSSVKHAPGFFGAGEIYARGSLPTLFVADPPWHVADYEIWIAALSRLLREGDKVLLVLPKTLSSRSSRQIRSRALSELGGWGDIDVLSDHVRYQTPEFERRMLSRWFDDAAISSWRQGDLVELVVTTPRHPSEHAALPPYEYPRWRPHLFGTRIIRVDDRMPTTGAFAFETPLEDFDNTLVSPSYSSMFRAGVNVFSSSGRAIRVTAGMQSWLDFLADRQLSNLGRPDDTSLQSAINILLS